MCKGRDRRVQRVLVYASLLLEGDDRWHAVKLYMFLRVELTKTKTLAKVVY